jgi:hypothetical protein
MDSDRFDELARNFAGPHTRRRALRAILGVAAGVLAGIAGGVTDVAAACRKQGRQCRGDQQCCKGLVCRQGSCRQGCRIAGRFVAAGAVNPTNQCQACRPNLSTTSWSNKADRTPCDDGNACTPNDMCFGGVCQPGGVTACPECQSCNPRTGSCEPDPSFNGRSCSTGVCGSNGECVDPACCSGDATCANYTSVGALCCIYPQTATCCCDTSPGAGDGFVRCCTPGIDCPRDPGFVCESSDWAYPGQTVDNCTHHGGSATTLCAG